MMRTFYRRCCVVGCREEHSSLHQPPASGEIRTQWIDFIFNGNVPAKVSRRLNVCAGHFPSDRFTNLNHFKLGLAKKLCLKEGSIPTIRFRTREKRDVGTSGESLWVHNVTSQTDTLKTCTDGSQLQLKTLELTDTQRTMSCRDVSESDPLQAAALMKRSWTRSDPKLDEGAERSVDRMWDPAEPSDVTSIQKKPSYIVSEMCLLELFEVCPVCRKVSDVRTRRLGAFVSVEQQCPHCQFSRKWNSQRVVESSPADQLRLSAAVYVSASSFLKLEKIFQTMQLKMFRGETFQSNSRLYVEPEILQRWETAEDGVSEQLGQQQNPILRGDSLDVQQLLVIKEEPPWSSSLDQQESEPIKEEEEEPWTSQEREQLRGQVETDANFSFAVSVKREADEEKPPSSHPHPTKTKDRRQTEPPASSSDEHMKTETDEEGCGGAEPSRNLDLNTRIEPNADEKASSVFEMDVSVDEDDVWQKPWSDSEPEPDDGGGRPECRLKGATQPADLNVSSGRKSFTCDVCGKAFPRVIDLKRHVGVHTTERPFICTCGKTFRLEKILKSHMRSHTSQKPFSCDVCGKRFIYQSCLNSHKKIHTGEKPFGCSICGRKCSTKAHFQRHLRVHTGEKPHSCDVCAKRFSLEHHLKRHLLTHRDEKPFGCGICGKRFMRQDRLKRHVRLH